MNGDNISGITKIYINVTILLIVIMVGVILCIGYILFPSIDDKLIFITSVIGGSCALYSAFYVGRTLRLQYRMTLMHNSFELLSNVHSLELMKVRSELDRKFDHRNVTPAVKYGTHLKISIQLDVLKYYYTLIKYSHTDDIGHGCLCLIVGVFFNLNH